MTFNRKSQLSTLEKLYNVGENDAVVLYSTTDSDLHEIIKEFLINKDFFYYRAIQVSKEEQLNQFIINIEEQLAKGTVEEQSYAGAINAMMQEKCEKRVIVIDEFQHIVKYSEDLMADILKCINNKWGNQPVLFVLLSTNAYFIEHQMVEKLGTLAYELSGLVKIPDLTFIDLVRYFDKYSKEDLIYTYAITGGKPYRIKAFDKNSSLKDNVINSILSEDGYLYKRGFDILPKELREHSVYNTILVNIAAGRTKLNDLHKATGYSRAKISVYINNLIEHDLIEKIDSFDTIGKDNTVKGVYTIKDDFLAFFYRFVFPYESLLHVMDKDKFYKKYILPHLSDYAKTAFRKVCLECLMLLNQMGKLPINVKSNGIWLGKVGNIDIVCTDDDDRYIIGLCEFKKDTITLEDFEWLEFCVEKARLTGDIYYLFSKKDFDDRLKEYAKQAGNIFLIDLSMI